MIAFEMADLRFDGTSPASAPSFSPCRVLATLPGDVHVGPAGVAMTSIAFVDLRISYGHAQWP